MRLKGTNINVFTLADFLGVIYNFQICVDKETCPTYGFGFSGKIFLALCKYIPGNKFSKNLFPSLPLAIA